MPHSTGPPLGKLQRALGERPDRRRLGVRPGLPQQRLHRRDAGPAVRRPRCHQTSGGLSWSVGCRRVVETRDPRCHGPRALTHVAGPIFVRRRARSFRRLVWGNPRLAVVAGGSEHGLMGRPWRCAYCGIVIGVYEPLVVMEEDGPRHDFRRS